MGIYEYSAIEKEIMSKSVIPFAIYQFADKKVNTVQVSDGFVKMFGFADLDEAYNTMEKDIFKRVHRDDYTRFADATLNFISTDKDMNLVFRAVVNGNCRIIHAFGKKYYTEEGVKLGVVWYVDEGEFKEDEINEDILSNSYNYMLNDTSLNRRIDYDPMTGLPTMTHFFNLVQNNRSKYDSDNRHCCIGFANFNGLKYYNKRYGFVEGDKLIIDFSTLLSSYFGTNLSCRIGQDNFAFFAVMDGVEEKLKALTERFDELTAGRNISARIGIYPDTMGVIETSQACDRAKFACNTLRTINNSSYAYFDEKMLIAETNKQYIIDNIDRAIEEKWIKAYYQPIIRAANGRVCDEEALARWLDPVKGMLSPADFIPILEDSKLIYKVDLYMVDQILEKMKAQKAKGLYVVPMSVNLSRTDFESCDIVDEICRRVDAAGIDREKLTIEITESVIGSDFEFMKEQVELFQERGFKVWMDDFGSGYSSLDLLQDMRFDLIKLDMRFMKQFNNNEKSRIIITELMKMATGLGIETVAEGVETKEQVDFLCEVGCTKLQGYYYCKPIPYEAVFERYDKGVQIGFENPAESKYYESLGRINLYDTAVLSNENPESFGQYFNTFPMAIVETDITGFSVTRCNKPYRDFLGESFGKLELGVKLEYGCFGDNPGKAFTDVLQDCMINNKNSIFFEEKISEEYSVHAYLKRIAVNPVTGVLAFTVVILGMQRRTAREVTYADVANSLSADYINLYYVNVETEEFIEYRPDPKKENLSVERHGTDFFTASRKDALDFIYKEDAEKVVSALKKENILEGINAHGIYNITYRLMINNKPTYVSLKAVRMSNDDKHIIIGVNNIDAWTRQQQALEKMKAEQVTYTRISALFGNYICIYMVDPEKNTYTQYGANGGFEGLDLAGNGEDFFEESKRESTRIIYKDDLRRFNDMFTKENIMKEIREKGVFILDYRLVMGGKPTYVRLKAAMIEEKNGPQIIVGVGNVDAQVRRDIKYVEDNYDE
ncbi:MAG: GGDEF domain-containing phosphodiesterase [Eubacterium sp.]|nr:GGDEF domain-containing phosphodiesterase [Eubacterium sp.]